MAAFAASLEQRGSADLVAWGRSMWPTLWPGSRLAVEACSPRDLSPGELAVARTTGGLVVHRVVASSETGVRLRGDAYDAEDMGDMEILGRVVSLHLGPARWSPPSSAWALRAHRAQAHVVPWVRAGTRAALPLARSAYRAAVASSTRFATVRRQCSSEPTGAPRNSKFPSRTTRSRPAWSTRSSLSPSRQTTV